MIIFISKSHLLSASISTMEGTHQNTIFPLSGLVQIYKWQLMTYSNVPGIRDLEKCSFPTVLMSFLVRLSGPWKLKCSKFLAPEALKHVFSLESGIHIDDVKHISDVQATVLLGWEREETNQSLCHLRSLYSSNEGSEWEGDCL